MADQPISAQTMARAAQFDPQFSVPARPRIRRGLVVRHRGDHLVVDGAPIRHVLRGKAATQLLPRLLPLLDGVRDHDALACTLGVSAKTVFTALSLLWTTGVVEEAAPPDVDVSWVAPPLADFLSRMGDTTEANPGWEHAAARLSAARVHIHGDPRFREAIAEALAGSLPTAVDGTDTPAPDATLIVLAIGFDGVDAHRALIDACWSSRVPLLRVGYDGRHVEIGPYVDATLSPCLDCLIATDSPAEPVAGDTVPDGDHLRLAAGLAAADLVALVSRAARVGLPTRWRRIGLTRLAQAQCSGATRPGCARCGTEPTSPRPAPLAARYEAAVALPPREYADVKAHQVHYQPANVALQRGHKTWPVAPRHPLPTPDVERLAGSPSSVPVDGLTRDDLALLLMVAAGWQRATADRVWRWTATGGNIGSVVAHVLVRDIDGMAPGLYGYVPSVHQLALLHDGAPPTCPPVDGRPCTAPACMLLTADLARVASKYSAFGLRVVLLDAGCAHTAILDAAEWIGLAPVAGTAFDDEVMAGALGTDIDAEPITGLIHLRVRTGSETT